MTTLQKGIVWVTGCLMFIFALSIALGWYCFGYLDPGTLGLMALMLAPVLVFAIWYYGSEERRAQESPAKTPNRAEPRLEVSSVCERR